MKVDTPPASSPAALKTLTSQHRRDTKPELELRRRLHAAGLRYRLDHPLPGMPRRRADVLFPRERVAVFVDGCFWHACPTHLHWPKANSAWWVAKLTANQERDRDRDTDARLMEQGWLSVRVREHEDPASAAEEVARVVRSRRSDATDPRGA